MSIQNKNPTDSTSTVTQTSIPSNALVNDTRQAIEDNRELASMVYREKSFYAAHIQTELRRRFGWNVSKADVRTAIDELGSDVVKACARPHPEGR